MPKRTETVPTKLLPRMVTLVPPVSGPTTGVILEMFGAGRNLYLLASVCRLVPPTVDTVTLEFPTPDGTVRRISDGEITCTRVATLPPKRTDTVPVKPFPHMVTLVPAFSGPKSGVSLSRLGRGTKVN